MNHRELNDIRYSSEHNILANQNFIATDKVFNFQFSLLLLTFKNNNMVVT